MENTRERERYIRKKETDKKRITELTEEITALRQLLDCAAANIAILTYESGGERRISAKEVKSALGKYELHARREGDDYLIEAALRSE